MIIDWGKEGISKDNYKTISLSRQNRIVILLF